MKIITAIGESYLNEKLKNYEEIEVIGRDIPYQDGILEVLEKRKDIDVLLISDLLPKEYEFSDLINKIIKLSLSTEIIVFLKEKNDDLEKFLNSKDIYKIYYLENFSINNLIEILDIKKNENDISKEINDLKEIILKDSYSNSNFELNKKNIKYKRLKNLKLELKRINNKFLYRKKEEFHIGENKIGKVLVVSGNFGSGKSIFSCILAKVISDKNKKTLLVDFDILNNSVNTIFGIKKNSDKINKNYIESFIMPINKNLNVLCGMDSIYKDENFYNIYDMFNNFREEYEYIIVDTSSNINFKYVKTVLSSSEKIIFLVEPNISEIKKASNLLEVFLKDYNLDIDKIKIVFNKTNSYQIAESILEEIFSDFEIVGNVKYDEKINLIINKNVQIMNNIEEFEKIIEVLNLKH